ncbi:glycosyltransferase family 39 protein [candidate division KSB1 bacterium]|nr:glycosyltransferase family 39 protein [candidate division KSB1 bacterium]
MSIIRRLRGAFYAYLLILVIGLVLRCIMLDSQSLWYDEAVSISIGSSDDPEILIFEEFNHPPFYHVLLHIWMRIAGHSIYSARLFSALLGLLAIILGYRLASRLFGARVGRVTAAIMAFSPFMIYFSQEARMYNLIIVLVLGSFSSFISILDANRRRAWIGYFISNLLLVYTYYLSVFVLMGQLVYFLVLWREHKQSFLKILTCQIAIVLLFVPWLLHLIQVVGSQERSYSQDFIFRVPYLFFTFTSGYSGLILNYYEKLQLMQTIREHIFYLAIVGSLIGFITIWGIKAAWRNKKAALVLAVFLVLPIIFVSVLFPIVPLLSERYLAFVSPAFYMLLALGLVNFPTRFARILISTAFASIFVLSLYNYYFNPAFGKEQWKEVAQHIRENSKPGDTIVFQKDYGVIPYHFYAWNAISWFGIPERPIESLNQDSLELRRLWVEDEICRFDDPKFYALDSCPDSIAARAGAKASMPHISDWAGEYNHVWLVLSKNFDTEFFYRDLFARLFTQVEQKVFPKMNGITVCLYEVHNQRMTAQDKSQ